MRVLEVGARVARELDDPVPVGRRGADPSPDLRVAVLSARSKHLARAPALPVAETVKRVRGGLVEATLDREGLWAIQTPQAFRAALLREAHDKALRDGARGTDDAMLVERLGQPVGVVPGSAANVKITTPEDLRKAREWTRR